MSTKVHGGGKPQAGVPNFGQKIEQVAMSQFSPSLAGQMQRSPYKSKKNKQTKVNVVKIAMSSRQAQTRRDDIAARQRV